MLGMLRSGILAVGLVALSLTACASTSGAGAKAGEKSAAAKPLRAGLDPGARPDAFPTTYRPLPSNDFAIVGARAYTGTGQALNNATIVIRSGRIAAIGEGLEPPQGVQVVDARGKWVSPGLIDSHSHLGVYASPAEEAHSDGNELTSPTTPQVWAEHSVWPQDPGFNTARIGGVTTVQVLPGSGNLIGGRGVTLRNVPSRTVQGMKFPGAPYTLKMACGENPKRVYGSKGQATATWAGWWGFKLEAFDSVEANVPLLQAAGACAVIKSDDADLIQRLNQEAAMALAAGRAAGLQISEAEAMAWITANPAKAIGILDQTGTLEAGKRADIVIWDRNPFSIYARTEKVYIDGALTWDRRDPRYQPRSDFDLGQPGEGVR